MESEARTSLWIKQAEAGSQDAFLLLYRTYSPAVYRLLLSIVRNREEAEDGTQEVFLRVHKNLASFRMESKFSTWVYRIAVNWAMDSKRKVSVWIRMKEKLFAEQKRKPRSVMAHPSGVSPLNTLGRGLTRAQRAVVELRVVQEQSGADTAAILGVSEGTIKTHLFRGLRKMRKVLAAQGKNK